MPEPMGPEAMERVLCLVFPTRIEKMGNTMVTVLFWLRLRRLATGLADAVERHAFQRAKAAGGLPRDARLDKKGRKR